MGTPFKVAIFQHPRVVDARQFAAICHQGQFRKYQASQVDYSTHPCRVAEWVATLENTTLEMVCAAYLHDVVEDCGVSLETISQRSGSTIGNLVKELTNTSKIDLPRASREERRAADRARLAKVSPEAKIIKMIDRIDNLRELDGAPIDFILLYCDEVEKLRELIKDAHADLADTLLLTINKVRDQAKLYKTIE